MLVCVLIGLGGRTIAMTSATAGSCVRPVESCCESHHDSSPKETHHHEDGDDCPLEHHHHHHGGCSQPLPPLAVDSDFICSLGVPESSLLGVRHEGEVPPEGPFLCLEKPPLI